MMDVLNRPMSLVGGYEPSEREKLILSSLKTTFFVKSRLRKYDQRKTM